MYCVLHFVKLAELRHFLLLYHCHYKGPCIDDGDCYNQCTSYARGLCKLETSPPINSDYTLPGKCCCV
ncbi:hypothetical protein MKX03_024498 [Papaver bracteatum]|nr:hypothetical protein MKX03_024498 [Papaver bracteatum]